MLIIGYGNPLRGDDAVGVEAAQRLNGLALHQLTPDLMEPISQAEEVIFIDATPLGIPGTITRRSLTPSSDRTPFTHHASPEALLTGAKSLYGRCPPATLITIAGSDFELGHPLSKPVRAALENLICRPAKGLRAFSVSSVPPCLSSSTPPQKGPHD